MPVGLSLSIVMLLLGMPGTGPILLTAAPIDIFPIGAHAVAGLVLLVLDYDHQGTLKWQSLLCACPGGYTACLGAHSKVLGRERDGS